MSGDPYYREHWVQVSPERLEAYERMFEWSPLMAPLLEGAQLAPGQAVLDLGCGPGGLAVELARRVGPGGRVVGLDINAAFVERARQRAAEEGLADRIEVIQFDGHRLPVEEASLDRAVCKNVLEYVDDPVETLAGVRRVLRPGGLVHAVDSDWGMLVVEPLGPEAIAELIDAASPAFRTPLIGRKLRGAFRAAGLGDVRLQILAMADTVGFAAPVLRHMASYARETGRMDEARIAGLIDRVERSIEDGSYLMILPQFLVTGTA